MFSVLIENNFIDELQKRAEKCIIKERNKYKFLHDFILEFCKNNKLIIRNIDFLLDEHKYWDNIDIYSISPETMSKKLLENLCQNFGNKFLLRMNKEGEKYSIQYDLRYICNIQLIQKYNNLSIQQLIPLNKKNGINLFPSFLEIIDLYKFLYNPDFAEDWEDLYNKIKKLEKDFFDPQIKKIISNNKLKINKEKNSEINSIKLLCLEFIKSSNFLIHGDVSYLIYQPKKSIKSNIDEVKYIEIVSENDIKTDFKSFIQFFEKHTKYGFITKKNTLYLPGEILMEINTIYMIYTQYNTKTNIEIPILEIYNNCSYELIHYHELNDLKVVDAITQLRFLYIKIWHKIIKQKINSNNENECKNYIHYIYEQIKFYREKIDLYECKKNYVGTYVNIDIYEKINKIFNSKLKYSYYCHNIL